MTTPLGRPGSIGGKGMRLRMRKIAGSIVILFCLVLAMALGQAQAHEGETDKNGCHKDGYGRWHCH